MPTIADLRSTGAVRSSEIVAAIDRYMRDPATGSYRFTSGHSLDIGAVVATAPEIADARANPGPQEKAFRTAVAAAVMRAQAVPPIERR